ncbi:hypothetical protein B0J12DRAFT_689938 [Macrophomina phaseolina]|uniref:Secreted protein n=1 Tax=Macrophomina phaseolina TaxID=35725 RepID=A0ABQ8FRR2_9PEZI|nr:hypothetical protein B0J12DRAFT_689938 [Macrophomina phaseolina]
MHRRRSVLNPPICSFSFALALYLEANSPVTTYTDTRIRSLEPRSSLSGQDPSEGVRSSEPAVAAKHYAPRAA